MARTKPTLEENLSMITILQQDNDSLLNYLEVNADKMPASFSALIFLIVLDSYPKEKVRSFFQKTKLHIKLKAKFNSCNQYKCIVA